MFVSFPFIRFLSCFLSDAPQCQLSSVGTAAGLTFSSSSPSQIDGSSTTGRSIYYAKIGETVNITCDLDARPSHNVTFYWTLNNQISERLQILGNARLVRGGGATGEQVSSDGSGLVSGPGHGYATNPLRSVASIVPRTSADFGIVRCWARNPIGYQATPCMFVLNQSQSSPTTLTADTSPGGGSLSPSVGNSIDATRQQQQQHQSSSDLNNANLAASSETSLIGSTASHSPKPVLPSSYSAHSRVANNIDTSSSSAAAKANRNKPIQHGNMDNKGHHLSNHRCHLNRTPHSVALNCSLIGK